MRIAPFVFRRCFRGAGRSERLFRSEPAENKNVDAISAPA
jgi:hypothetical protein